MLLTETANVFANRLLFCRIVLIAFTKAHLSCHKHYQIIVLHRTVLLKHKTCMVMTKHFTNKPFQTVLCSYHFVLGINDRFPNSACDLDNINSPKRCDSSIPLSAQNNTVFVIEIIL